MRLKESLERLGLGLKSSGLRLSAIAARGSYVAAEMQNAAFA
jgi:hypothetical protein